MGIAGGAGRKYLREVWSDPESPRLRPQRDPEPTRRRPGIDPGPAPRDWPRMKPVASMREWGLSLTTSQICHVSPHACGNQVLFVWLRRALPPGRGQDAEAPAWAALQPPMKKTSERRRSAVGRHPRKKGEQQTRWRGPCCTCEPLCAAVAMTMQSLPWAPLRRRGAHEGRLRAAPCLAVLGGNCPKWAEGGCHRILRPSAPTSLRATPIAPPDILASAPPLGGCTSASPPPGCRRRPGQGPPPKRVPGCSPLPPKGMEHQTSECIAWPLWWMPDPIRAMVFDGQCRGHGAKPTTLQYTARPPNFDGQPPTPNTIPDCTPLFGGQHSPSIRKCCKPRWRGGRRQHNLLLWRNRTAMAAWSLAEMAAVLPPFAVQRYP